MSMHGQRTFGIGIAIAIAAAAAQGPTLTARIEKLIDGSPAAKAAFWGVQVTDLATGKTLAEVNSDKFFVPASNTKLFTTALALTKIGPDYKFQTRVLADAPPDAQGRVAGDLRLLGGGDANLSPRQIPYTAGAINGDPLIAIADLADQLAKRGITRIDGDIVGDDSWFVWEPYGDGWSIGDPLYEYGAPVSALAINDNTLWINVRPGTQEGDPAGITLNPPLEYYHIDNRVRTVAAGGERRVRYSREPGSMTLELWGTMPMGGRPEDLQLAMADPAHYAALALRQALEDRGITVAGKAVARHLYRNQVPDLRMGPPAVPDSGTELAARTSPPFFEDLRVTAKVSQNLHAEMDLRDVGRVKRNVGSVEAGLIEMQTFLTEIGVPTDGYTINDGSGLARINMVTPNSVVKLLRFMYGSPSHDYWLAILPVGGADGTLANRFHDMPWAGKIHAKTGSLSHVSALSGYAERRPGKWVAFSIFVNNFNAPAGEVRAIMDRICALILE